MIYPKEYIVWNYSDYDLELIKNDDSENPKYIDLSNLDKFNILYLKNLNSNNTNYIFNVHYTSKNSCIDLMIVSVKEDSFQNVIKNLEYNPKKTKILIDEEKSVIISFTDNDELNADKIENLVNVLKNKKEKIKILENNSLK